MGYRSSILAENKLRKTVKLFETCFTTDIFASFNEFQCQGTDTFSLVIFEPKLSQFTIKTVCYISFARIFFLQKLNELSVLVVSEINSSY